MACIEKRVFQSGQNTLVIQSAYPSDAGELLSFIYRANRETDFLAYAPDEFRMTLEEEQRYLEDRLKNACELFLIARLNGILVGTLGVNAGRLRRYTHKVSFGISVSRNYWGLGIGRRLIETMIEWADTIGLAKITLEVDTLNTRAIGLYKSMGFVEEGLLRLDRRMESGEFRDSLVMARFNPYFKI